MCERRIPALSNENLTWLVGVTHTFGLLTGLRGVGIIGEVAGLVACAAL